MTTHTRHTAALGTAATLAAFVLLCAQAVAAGVLSPLPPSAYTVSNACPAPSPGHATCLAMTLVAASAEAGAHTHPLGVARAPAQATPSPAAGDFGLRPQDLHAAYQLPLSPEPSSRQTIALVDAYNDLSAEEDLESYDTEFALPKCTTADGCFEKVDQNGNDEAASLPFPQSHASLTQEDALCDGREQGESWQRADERESACGLVSEAEGWSVEISLDIETAHAICQSCQIALVEANSSAYANLETAEGAAVHLGAGEISNSWGGPECMDGECLEASAAFNHPGTVITAAAGDDGYLDWLSEPRSRSVDFPASSPQVVAVGGTRLDLGPEGEWAGETVWNGGGQSNGRKDGYGASGGGCSVQFTAQPWQLNVTDSSAVGCGDKRAVADVSADADPYTGLAVYDSGSACKTRYEEEVNGKKVEHVIHWCTIGGTSLASPLIASAFALAGGAHGVRYPARTLYENAAKSPASLHDVTEGSNGECLSPFDEQTGLSACTPGEEAEASCSSQLICRAGAGYDGPTGVGTPNGIAAFQVPAGGWGEEPADAAETGASAGGESPAREGGESSGGSATSPSPAAGAGSPAPAAGAAAAKPPVRLSGLALTLNALLALNTARPKIPQLAFSFTINRAAPVRASLARRGHGRWQALAHSLRIAAVSGRNTRRFGGHGVLSSGTYRLTLTPVHGAARSIVFKIG
jgi:hypothetical protein